jgi:ribosomal protein L11 methyltransferase
MKAQTLWQVSVTTAKEAEDAVAALLERLFGQRASIFSAESGSTSTATIYSAKTRQLVHSKRDALEAGLKHLANCGLDLPDAQVLIRKVPREDWSASWKKHFKVLEIGSELVIKPSWSKRRAKRGEAVVTLDPGLSFGTGQHPTTAFCLEQLVAARKEGSSLLDIGSGSGILAIAAVKLGYKPVRALDNDPTAVRVAKANARQNRVEHKLTITRQDLTRLSAKSTSLWDVICANLTQDLLLSEHDRILARLRPGGRLVLAGLLVSQFPAVVEAYTAAGLRLDAAREEAEWKSGAFILPRA